jgi:hypothetical protein
MASDLRDNSLHRTVWYCHGMYERTQVRDLRCNSSFCRGGGGVHRQCFWRMTLHRGANYQFPEYSRHPFRSLRPATSSYIPLELTLKSNNVLNYIFPDQLTFTPFNNHLQASWHFPEPLSEHTSSIPNKLTHLLIRDSICQVCVEVYVHCLQLLDSR